MIHELIVTSVPRGLQAGRSGFTTVLRTRGIHPQLAETLERASGYRHVFPQGDPRNPQIRSHAVVTGATGVVSILSRIGDAGSDYSGRSNKLAHHIAIDAGETAARASSNPAAVLLALERSGGFQRQWAGEPREQPAGPQVPTVPSEPGACRAWARLAGDAGWAGLLVDRALAKQPTWIIAPQGLDLLELFAEALSLVNYPQRWGITFTTFALSAGDGLWLGTVDGSPEAQAARGQSRVAVVDLVRRAPLTATSPMIEAARGTGPVPWKREAPRTVTAGPAAAAVAGLPPMLPTGPIAAGPTSDVLRGVPALPPLLSPAGPPALNGNPPPLAPAQPAAAGGPLLPAGGSWNGAPQRSAGPLLAGMAFTFLVVCCAIVFVVVRQLSEPPPLVDKPPPVAEHVVPPKPESEKPVKAIPEPPSKTPSKPVGPSPEELAAKQERMKAEAARQEAEAEKEARKAAFTQLRERLEKKGHLPLKDKDEVNLKSQLEEKITLCKLDDAEVEVSLPKLPKVNLVSGQPWQLECKAAEGNAWSITATPDDAAGEPIEIGRVEAKQGELALTLLPMPDVRDPLWVAAREAVTTAPLVLRLPGENSQEFETFVQPCLPKRRDPIVLTKLLTEKEWYAATKERFDETSVDLPSTPWPIVARFVGRKEGEISGELKDGSEPFIRLSPKSTEVTALWALVGEDQPFMRTTFTMLKSEREPATSGGWRLEVRFKTSEVLEPWSGWKRIGAVKEVKEQGNQTKPQLYLKKDDRDRVDSEAADEDKLLVDLLKDFAFIALAHRPALNHRLCVDASRHLALGANKVEFTGSGIKDPERPLDYWEKVIRLALKNSPGYKRWVDTKARDPGDPPKPERDGKVDTKKENDWKAKRDARARYLPEDAGGKPVEPPEDVVKDYWEKRLKPQGTDRAEGNAGAQWSDDLANEFILCCLHFELREILAEKRKAKRLFKAVGQDGTPELTGQLWADPVEDGKYKVLLAEFRKQDEGKPPAAPASPPGEDENSQPAVSSAK